MLNVCNKHNVSFVVNNINPDRNECPVCFQEQRADDWMKECEKVRIELSKMKAFIENQHLTKLYNTTRK